MFPRDTPNKRKNDQDFSPVKYRCSSELDVSLHSQDENVHHPYFEDVEFFTEQSWSISPWQPNDDLQMKQFEDNSFLSVEEKTELKMLESVEKCSEGSQDSKSSISFNGKKDKNCQHKINLSESIFCKNNVQIEDTGLYDERIVQENNSLLDISTSEHGNELISSEDNKEEDIQFYYNNHENKNKYECPLPLQLSSDYHEKDNYVNDNKSNNLKSEFKDNVKGIERIEHIENNSSNNVSLKTTNFRNYLSSKNSVAHILKSINKDYDKYQNNSFVNYNQDKSPTDTLPKFEKIMDLDTGRCSVKSHEIYENASYGKCSNFSLQSLKLGSNKRNIPEERYIWSPVENNFDSLNNYIPRLGVSNNHSEGSLRSLSSKSLSSPSDSENWRQSNNLNPYFGKQEWKNTENNEPSNSMGSIKNNKIKFNREPNLWNLSVKDKESSECNISSVGLQPAYSSDIISSKTGPSNIYNWTHAGRSSPLEADVTNWRHNNKIESLNMDLNPSVESNNWRQPDPVIITNVKRIIGKRERNFVKEYLVRWYETRVDTWEKEDTLTKLHMPALQKYLNKMKKIMEVTTELINTKFDPGFIDTHCHLDFIYNKLKSSEKGINYRQVCEKEYKFPLSYEGCITCFCDPSTFREIAWYENFLLNEEVYVAFGCHPHHSNRFGEVEEEYLKVALKHMKNVALGEIGLDYSGRNDHSKELQKEVFKKQLKIAVDMKKPLVIHCRDAHDDCIQILRECVPNDTRIHRHCFTEPWDKAVEWLSLFKNCFIGITNLISQESKRGYIVRHVAAEMPLERLLLETDAPYFHPYCLSDDPSGQTWYVSNPGMALHVASEIARIRGIKVQEVLWHARNNTRKMYGI